MESETAKPIYPIETTYGSWLYQTIRKRHKETLFDWNAFKKQSELQIQVRTYTQNTWKKKLQLERIMLKFTIESGNRMKAFPLWNLRLYCSIKGWIPGTVSQQNQ